MPDRNHSEPDASESDASESDGSESDGFESDGFENSGSESGGQADQTLDDERAWLDRHVDEQEEESFPASDPHADWSGPWFGRDLPEAVTDG
jgi:hypothetical protein